MENPQRKSESGIRSRLVSHARLTLAKHDAARVFADYQRREGPQAELQTKILYSCIELIQVDKIIEDKHFTNFRTNIDPDNLDILKTSISLEGLRVPIVVVATMPEGHYHVRAGFRRTMAIRQLGWTEIPAIVLPSDTPESEEYWTNIIENTAREKLTPYELASAAKMMRDRFGVSANAFAQKSGHAPSYIINLLTCLDRLPLEVLNSWRRGDKVPFEIYLKLACMTPLEAIKNLRLFIAQHRINNDATRVEDTLRKLQSRRKTSDRLLTVRGIERTQRLLMAIKVSDLSEDRKELCKELVEYCQGCRKRVTGIIKDKIPTTDEFSTPDRDIFALGAEPAMLPQVLSDEMEAQRRKMKASFEELDKKTLQSYSPLQRIDLDK